MSRQLKMVKPSTGEGDGTSLEMLATPRPCYPRDTPSSPLTGLRYIWLSIVSRSQKANYLGLHSPIKHQDRSQGPFRCRTSSISFARAALHQDAGFLVPNVALATSHYSGGD